MKDITYKIGDSMKSIIEDGGHTRDKLYKILRFTDNVSDGTRRRNWWYKNDYGHEDWWTEHSDTTKSMFIHVPKYHILDNFTSFVRSTA